MEIYLISWLFFRMSIAFTFLVAFQCALRIRDQRAEGLREVKKLMDAPSGLPILGHAVSFSRDMAGFSMKLK